MGKKNKIISLFLLLLAITLMCGCSEIKKSGYGVDYDVINKFKDPVVYNQHSRIYHEPYCEWAKKCTKNCVYIEREKVLKKFANKKHCKVCRY